MNWNQLLSSLRHGKETVANENTSFDRTQFQRDYDRLIFSSPFRRLQNKTQVFPLPGSTFVHNRLTHSLETASVGRSLGTIFSTKFRESKSYDENPLIDEIGTIVSVACLAHDLGNPSFGHSGEKAISHYFIEGQGSEYEKRVSKEEWKDLISFEGNANTFRILTHLPARQTENPFCLTYSVLASLIKYPCESTSVGYNKLKITKKYGTFQSDKATFERLFQKLGIQKISDNPMVFSRHPLSYLVEAADDICYNIIDLEDAHRLKIISEKEAADYLLSLLGNEAGKAKSRMDGIRDANDRISFLRAKAINRLINHYSETFFNKQDEILKGELSSGLDKYLDTEIQNAMKIISHDSVEKIYNAQQVIEKEIAGYKIIGELLEELVPAVLSKKKNHYQDKLLKLIPNQFHTEETSAYEQIMSVLDFISGMTDLFAVELYRKTRGM